jgi:uncharacterized protein YyaL (SSP411 family)
MSEPKDFALLTLNRILTLGWSQGTGLAHVIAYPDGPPAARIPGVLDDYAFLVHACLDAWTATGDLRYYSAASEIAEEMIARFYDKVASGFYDAESPREGEKVLGALAARRKPLQDSPTPAGNPSAASALLRLEALNGNQQYRESAEDTLESFAGIVEHFGLYAGTYGLALERLLLDPIQVVIVGNGPLADELHAAAIVRYAVNKSVIRLRHDQLRADLLPPVLAETLPHLPGLSTDSPFAVVCKGRSCLPPIVGAEELLQSLT